MPSPLRIGILGGSFNPAHAGHLHVSMEALKRLKLDAVWWLVSPQNPLKPAKGMAPYAERFASAQAVTRGQRRIKISDFEKQHDLHYTHATLRALKAHYPHIRFVWLMGADNLASFHRWQHWRDIVNIAPVAIFDRAPFSHTSLRKKAATTLRSKRLRERDFGTLATRPGHWVYVLMRRHAASSTAIREGNRKA
jgi:nicotinate-nucleotide adenylyltransferase